MNKEYIVRYKDGPRKRQFKAMLFVDKYGSPELAAIKGHDIRPEDLISVKRAFSDSSGHEGYGNPRHYRS